MTPVPRCQLCSGPKVASCSLQSLTLSCPRLRGLASWAWAGRPPAFGLPGCSQDGPPTSSRPVPMRKAGPGEALRAPPALQPPGQAPGLCWRAAMLVAVATALPWGQAAPCPLLPPCRGRTAGQRAEGSFCISAGSSLSVGQCPGPPTVPGGPGCPALILSPLQPLLSAYPANGSLIGSLGKYFLEHLLHARHCPGPSHGPNRQTPAFVEHTLWGSGFPSDLEYPSFVCSCRSLPCRPCSSWQTILTLQKLAPSVPVVSGTV